MNNSLLSVSKNWPFFLFDLEGNFCHLVGRYAFSMFTKMPFSVFTVFLHQISSLHDYHVREADID